MLNPVVTLVSGQVTTPFAGSVKKSGITKKHKPLLWECMLGTVYAMDPAVKGLRRYFDYDYATARAYARVEQCSDLRLVKCPATHAGGVNGIRKGQWVLWGIPPATA